MPASRLPAAYNSRASCAFRGFKLSLKVFSNASAPLSEDRPLNSTLGASRKPWLAIPPPNAAPKGRASSPLLQSLPFPGQSGFETNWWGFPSKRGIPNLPPCCHPPSWCSANEPFGCHLSVSSSADMELTGEVKESRKQLRYQYETGRGKSRAFYSAQVVLEPSVDGGPCRITRHANMKDTAWNAHSHNIYV